MSENARTLAELCEEYEARGKRLHERLTSPVKQIGERELLGELTVLDDLARTIIAAQKRRIAALENAMEPFAGVISAWADSAGSETGGFRQFVSRLVTPHDFYEWCRAAYDLLHADEKGGAG